MTKAWSNGKGSWGITIHIGNGYSPVYQQLVDQYGKEKETIDMVLSWSGADTKIYKRMKDDIGAEGIAELQRQSGELTKRISQQPKNERDFEMDISLDSPFMR